MQASNGSASGAIPLEVSVFLSGKGGRSLIVKGGAGTGKTTFGLELLERMGKPNQSFYLSTRVSDEALYRQFPWLRASELRTRILDAGKLFLDTLHARDKAVVQELPEDQRAKITAAKHVMSAISDERGPPTRVDRAQLNALLR
ncbi:MAG: gas vesicle protein GvpD P-loop domain-containing protein, partial [Thermoplasmata archaeon]